MGGGEGAVGLLSDGAVSARIRVWECRKRSSADTTPFRTRGWAADRRGWESPMRMAAAWGGEGGLNQNTKRNPRNRTVTFQLSGGWGCHLGWGRGEGGWAFSAT